MSTSGPQSSLPAKGAPPKFKRRIVLIKKGFQLQLAAAILAAVAVGAALVYVDFYRLLASDAAGGLMDPSLRQLYMQTAKVILGKLVVYVVMVGVVAVFMSHRLAGPLYRFERSAAELGAGDLTHRVHLRRNDALKDFQDHFNRMAAALRDRVASDRALAERLSARVDELAARPDLPQEARARLKELKTEIDHITRAFKI